MACFTLSPAGTQAERANADGARSDVVADGRRNFTCDLVAVAMGAATAIDSTDGTDGTDGVGGAAGSGTGAVTGMGDFPAVGLGCEFVLTVAASNTGTADIYLKAFSTESVPSNPR